MIKQFLAFLVAVGLTAEANAQVIAVWDFEPDPLPVNLTNATFGPLAPSSGSGSLDGVHVTATTVWSSPSGNGSANSLSANNWLVGDYIQLTLSTVGFTGIGVSWDQFRSSTGPTTFTLQYSTDGSSFTDVPSFTGYAVLTNTWNTNAPNPLSSFSADLSSITALDNQATVYFRFTAACRRQRDCGTSRFDNVSVSVVPEPSTYAMLALAGAGLAGYTIRRRRR